MRVLAGVLATVATLVAATVEEVTLVSADGVELQVPQEAARMIGVVRTMLDEMDADADAEGEGEIEAFPLPNVQGATLARVVEYCRTYAVRGADPAWETPFVAQLDNDGLFDLILAANYLDVKPLLDLACARVAGMLVGKTPEEIRRLFHVVDEIAEEEADSGARRRNVGGF